MKRDRLRVMMSTPSIRPTTNPYISQLVASLEPHVEVVFFSWRRAIFGRYDVLHVHWPETFTSSPAVIKMWARRFCTMVLQLRLSSRPTALVRTAHNVAPHEARESSTDAAILRRWDRLTTLWIVLNGRTEPPSAAPRTLIPHGHYRDHFAGSPRSQADASRVSVVGHVRPYKGIEELISEIASGSDSAVNLHIAGRPSSRALADRLVSLAEGSEQIALELDFVDDPRLAQIITSSSLVLLPYREMHNSGVALLALSLGRPVLVPDNEVTRDLAQEVGEGWVHRISPDGVLPSIRRALEAGIPSGEPDLSARDWPVSAARHAAAYAKAVELRRGQRRST
ncbi:glycosyltransferase [Microbacterium sp. NPDC089318]